LATVQLDAQILFKKRICASIWTVGKNHCMMHGQQNVKQD